MEDGERLTRFFFKFEKERYEKNEVKLILDFDGIEVFTREEIESVYVDFYINFFFVELIDFECKEILLNGVNRFFFDVDRVVCEGVVIFAEFTVLLKIMNINKAFGFDGFSVEFYTKFWDFLGFFFLRVIN